MEPILQPYFGNLVHMIAKSWISSINVITVSYYLKRFQKTYLYNPIISYHMWMYETKVFQLKNTQQC